MFVLMLYIYIYFKFKQWSWEVEIRIMFYLFYGCRMRLFSIVNQSTHTNKLFWMENYHFYTFHQTPNRKIKLIHSEIIKCRRKNESINFKCHDHTPFPTPTKLQFLYIISKSLEISCHIIYHKLLRAVSQTYIY